MIACQVLEHANESPLSIRRLETVEEVLKEADVSFTWLHCIYPFAMVICITITHTLQLELLNAMNGHIL